MAVPIVRSFTQNSTISSSTSITLTKPTSPAVLSGDLLIIIVGNDDTTVTAQWNNTTLKPTGFTLINEAGNSSSDAHVAAFWRIADGTEGSTIAVPAQSSADMWGFYIHITGHDPTTPIHQTGADVNLSSGSTFNITGVTTTIADCLGVYCHAFDGGDGFPFSVSGTGWSESADITCDVLNVAEGSGSWGTKQLTATGASGTATVTCSVSDGSAGFQFAIAPAVEATPTASGTLAAQNATATGTATATPAATGTPAAQDATAAGTATSLIEASGALAAGAATVSGAASVAVAEVSGALAAQAATTAGTAEAAIAAQGALASGVVTTAGTAESVIEAAGTLQAQDASASGVVSTAAVQAAGNLQAGNASITGIAAAVVEAQGATQAQDAALAGVIEALGSPAAQPAAGGFDVESFKAATKAEKRRLKQYRKAQDELDRLLREAIEGEPEAAAAAAEAPQEAIAQAEAVLPEVEASDPRLAADMMQAIIALQKIMETLEAMQIQRAAIDDDEAMFILMMAA